MYKRQLYNLCYGDDSNDLFDELHDDIYYQIQGANEDYDELMEGDDIKLSDSRELWKLVNEIETYYNSVVKAPKIEWIYG